MTIERKQALAVSIIAAVIATTALLICFFVTGQSLPFFIGSFAIIALLAPFIFEAGSRAMRCANVLILTIVIFACWNIFAFKLLGSFSNCLRALLILLSFIAALGGVVAVLERVVILRTFRGAIVTIIALAWLAWPIWLTPRLEDPVMIQRLVDLNPIFNINAILSPRVEPWTQLPVMYRMTTLGQDVPYRFPRRIISCASLQAAFALGLILKRRARAECRD